MKPLFKLRYWIRMACAMTILMVYSCVNTDITDRVKENSVRVLLDGYEEHFGGKKIIAPKNKAQALAQKLIKLNDATGKYEINDNIIYYNLSDERVLKDVLLEIESYVENPKLYKNNQIESMIPDDPIVFDYPSTDEKEPITQHYFKYEFNWLKDKSFTIIYLAAESKNLEMNKLIKSFHRLPNLKIKKLN
jgi:hypothetical protein